jgi:predicted ester cyclase
MAAQHSPHLTKETSAMSTTDQPAQISTTPEENIAIVQKMIDCVVTDKMDGLWEVCADPFIWNYAYETRDPLVPLDIIIGKHERYRRSFGPDFHSKLVEIVAQDNKVVGRYSEGGTMIGELLGYAPTGKPLIFSGVCIWRIEDGKIAEETFFSTLKDRLREQASSE